VQLKFGVAVRTDYFRACRQTTQNLKSTTTLPHRSSGVSWSRFRFCSHDGVRRPMNSAQGEEQHTKQDIWPENDSGQYPEDVRPTVRATV
jgi:hypothetical protein